MKIFAGTSGSTTVPMSRPSTTQRTADAASERWSATRLVRTAGIAETADTLRVTSGPRISPETSSPSRRTAVEFGSSETSSGRAAVALATASSSVGSMPWRSTHRVATRYIAPVSKYFAPSSVATIRETVDLPVPEGPSMATNSMSSVFCSLMWAPSAPWFSSFFFTSAIYSPTAL